MYIAYCITPCSMAKSQRHPQWDKGIPMKGWKKVDDESKDAIENSPGTKIQHQKRVLNQMYIKLDAMRVLDCINWMIDGKSLSFLSCCPLVGVVGETTPLRLFMVHNFIPTYT